MVAEGRAAVQTKSPINISIRHLITKLHFVCCVATNVGKQQAAEYAVCLRSILLRPC